MNSGNELDNFGNNNIPVYEMKDGKTIRTDEFLFDPVAWNNYLKRKSKKGEIQNEVSITENEYIYLITDGNFFKVGVAKNVEDRLHGLQLGNPNKLSVFCYACTTESKKVERYLHKRYKHKLIHREWFSFKIDELNEIKSYLKAICKKTESKYNL